MAKVYGKRLMVIGLFGIGLSVIWWALFYGDLAPKSLGSGLHLRPAFPCFYSNSGICEFVQRAAKAEGRLAYSPFLLYISIAAVIVGFFMKYTVVATNDGDSKQK